MCILRLALGCVAMELKRSSVPERMLAHLASRALSTTKIGEGLIDLVM